MHVSRNSPLCRNGVGRSGVQSTTPAESRTLAQRFLPFMRTSAPAPAFSFDREKLANLITFLQTLGPISDEVKDTIRAELAKVPCPAALPWFNKAVEAEPTALAASQVDAIKNTLLLSAEATAFGDAASAIKAAQLEGRDLSDTETETLSDKLFSALLLRQDLVGGDAPAIAEAANDPALLQALVRVEPSGLSIADARSKALTKPNLGLLAKVFKVVGAMEAYHAYEVEGLENAASWSWSSLSIADSQASRCSPAGT